MDKRNYGRMRKCSIPWLNEEEEQHGRERNNERRADHRRASGVEEIREDIFEDE